MTGTDRTMAVLSAAAALILVMLAAGGLAAGGLAAGSAQPGAKTDAGPSRVVSINLCTDQLAMLLAQPGQLHSVSRLAADPAISPMAREAGNYPLNNATAEEIFLMKPDLVVAGMFTARTTVTLLRRLGMRVEEFAPASSFDGIRANIRRMSDLLNTAERGEAVIARFDADLAEARNGTEERLSIALYEVNSYTSGAGTLADEIVKAAGLANLASDLGHSGSVRLPLELLVAAQPDLVSGNARRYAGPALAEEILAHPAYRTLAKDGRGIGIDSRFWSCGTPFAAQAVISLAEQTGLIMPRASGKAP